MSRNVLSSVCGLQAGQESEVARLLVASGQWREEEIEEDRHYAELWVRGVVMRGGH